MDLGKLNTQGLLAILTMLAAFALLGVYVVRNETPDSTVVGLIALPLGAVVGFYFGHSNGTTSALATAATTLANSVNAQRVGTDAVIAASVVPPAQAPGA